MTITPRGDARVSVPRSYRKVPSSRPRAVGLLLGVAAASVGVHFGAVPAGVASLLLVGLAAIVAFAGRPISEIGRTRFRLIDASFVIFLGVFCVLEAWNSSELRHPFAVAAILVPAGAYVALVVARAVAQTPQDLTKFLGWFSAPAVLVSGIAVAQLARFGPAAAFISEYVSAEGYERRLELGWAVRGTSTIGHHTALGGYLACIVAAICLQILIARAQTARVPMASFLLLAAALIGQFTTLTFATIALSATIALVTLLIIGLRPVFVMLILASGVAAWALFGSQLEARFASQTARPAGTISWMPETISYRLGIWTSETIPAIELRPLLGWGSDVYAGAQKGWPVVPTLLWGSPESEYMRTLMSGGLLLLGAQVLLLLVAWLTIDRARRALGFRRIAPVAVLFLGVLIISLLHSHLANPGVPYVLWALVGAVSGLAESSDVRDRVGGRVRRRRMHEPCIAPPTDTPIRLGRS